MELERNVTEWINVMCVWGANVGVSVSESRTLVMLMKGSMSVNRKPRVEMNGRVMKYVESVKYLGIWMSDKMSFKFHFEYLNVKVTNDEKMRHKVKSEWGMRNHPVCSLPVRSMERACGVIT